jgi:hypothetical protein
VNELRCHFAKAKAGKRPPRGEGQTTFGFVAIEDQLIATCNVAVAVDGLIVLNNEAARKAASVSAI